MFPVFLCVLPSSVTMCICLTVHSTLKISVFSVFRAINCQSTAVLCSVCFSPSKHSFLCSSQQNLCSVFCFLCSSQQKLCSVFCFLCSFQQKLCSVFLPAKIVFCVLFSVFLPAKIVFCVLFSLFLPAKIVFCVPPSSNCVSLQFSALNPPPRPLSLLKATRSKV